MLFENEEAVKTMQKKALFKNWIEQPHNSPPQNQIYRSRQVNQYFILFLISNIERDRGIKF